MIRTIIVLLFVIIYLILSIITWLILDIVGLFSKKKKDELGFANVRWAFGIVWRLSGVKPVINGLDNIPKDQPVLFIANHQSFFDVILTYSLCPGITGFLSKQDFEKIPLLSHWMKKNYCLFLTRNDPRKDLKLIIKAQDFIKAGISMFVFPEGTRSKDGTLTDFHEATFKIATKTNALIIPVAITNTRAVFEDHLPFIKKTKVAITYMEPVVISELEGDDKKYIGAYTKRLIEAQLEKDKDLVK